MKFKAIYENLLNLYTEGVYDPHIFKVIFMTGPMGAGKSTIAQKLIGGTGLRSLNLDNFNELMIKKGQVPDGKLTGDQLQNSWEKVQKQKVNFLDGRLGLLVDGSGRNVEDIKENLQNLLNMGYDAACIMVNVPDVEETITRAQRRAAEQKEKYGVGRNIPQDFQRTTHEQIQKNIPTLQKIFQNNFFYIDTTKKDAELEKGDRKLKNWNRQLGPIDNSSNPINSKLQAIKIQINKFMSAPPSNPAALQWIAQQKQQRNTLV